MDASPRSLLTRSGIYARLHFFGRPADWKIAHAERADGADVGLVWWAALEIGQWQFCCKFHSRRLSEDIVYLVLGLGEHLGWLNHEAAGYTDKNPRALDPSTLPLRACRFHPFQGSVVKR